MNYCHWALGDANVKGVTFFLFEGLPKHKEFENAVN
jgi:hypothetical protein